MRKVLLLGAGLVMLTTQRSVAQDSTDAARPGRETHRWRDGDRAGRMQWRFPRDFGRPETRFRVRAPIRVRVPPPRMAFGRGMAWHRDLTSGPMRWQRDLLGDQMRWQRDSFRRQARWQGDFEGLSRRWHGDFQAPRLRIEAPRVRIEPWRFHRGPAWGGGRYREI